MKAKEFFTSYQIRKKFSSEARRRVHKYMQRQGYSEDFTHAEAAAAIIFLSCTCTRSDLETYGTALLEAGAENETFFDALSLTLSDPLRAATFERIIFDRMASKIVLVFIDGERMDINLNIPVTPDWKQPGGIEWERHELVLVADTLQEEFTKGEIINTN